jgi:hypothetical protein
VTPLNDAPIIPNETSIQFEFLPPRKKSILAAFRAVNQPMTMSIKKYAAIMDRMSALFIAQKKYFYSA